MLSLLSIVFPDDSLLFNRSETYTNYADEFLCRLKTALLLQAMSQIAPLRLQTTPAFICVSLLSQEPGNITSAAILFVWWLRARHAKTLRDVNVVCRSVSACHTLSVLTLSSHD